jgi:hypothetical protein
MLHYVLWCFVMLYFVMLYYNMVCYVILCFLRLGLVTWGINLIWHNFINQYQKISGLFINGLPPYKKSIFPLIFQIFWQTNCFGKLFSSLLDGSQNRLFWEWKVERLSDSKVKFPIKNSIENKILIISSREY